MLTIKLIEKDIDNIFKALFLVKEELKRQVIIDGGYFNKICAIDYNQLLIKNIFERKTPSPPYSINYAEWKKKHSSMGYPAPWRLSGALVNDIRVFRDGIGWGSGLHVTSASLGYGSREEDRRPVFMPTAEEYSAGGKRQERINDMLRTISEKWR